MLQKARSYGKQQSLRTWWIFVHISRLKRISKYLSESLGKNCMMKVRPELARRKFKRNKKTELAFCQNFLLFICDKSY
jgi:hypothetical protein